MKKILKGMNVVIAALVLVIIALNFYNKGILSGFNMNGVMQDVRESLGDNSGNLETASLLLSGPQTEAQAETQTPIVYTCAPPYLWYREQLDDKEKEIYDRISEGIAAYEDKITVTKASNKQLENVINCIAADRPDLFWFDGGGQYVSYLSGKTDFIPDYTFTKEDVVLLEPQVEEAADKALSGITEDMDQYQKAKYLYEYLIDNTSYDITQIDQSFISTLLNHTGVCQGYTEAYQYLLGKLGIPATMEIGVAEGEPHSWNQVYLDEKWYQADVTWGDFDAESPIDYSFCFVTDEQLLRDHTIEMEMTVPPCVSTDNNYFIREGLQMYGWDYGTYEQIFANEYYSGKSCISVRLDSAEAYQQAISELVEQRRFEELIIGYLEQDSISIRRDDEQWVISMIL